MAAVAVVAVFAAFIFMKEFFVEKAESFVFGGQITKIESNVIYIEGYYMTKEGAEYAILKTKSNPEKRIVMAEIIPDTVFEKTTFTVPDLPPGRSFKPAELDRETIAGSLEEIEREKPGIFVTAGKNIFNKNKFKAVKVEYIIPVFSE